MNGDTSCADHHIGWRVRNNLLLDDFGSTVGGVSGDPDRPDNIIYDIEDDDGFNPESEDSFGRPTCLNTGDETSLPAVN